MRYLLAVLLLFPFPQTPPIKGRIIHQLARQDKRTPSCTTLPKAFAPCATMVVWPEKFENANYTVVCTIGVVSGSPFVLSYGNKSADSVVVTIASLTAVASKGTIDCSATHD